MSDINKIKEKLAKLLRLGSDDGASEGEIQNALNIATQLMARHQLTREDIDMSDPDPTTKIVWGRHFAFSKRAKATSWERALQPFVRKFVGSVSGYRSYDVAVRRNGIAELRRGSPRRADAFVFYGPDEDAACAAELFEELRDAIATMATVRWGGWLSGPGAAYAFGFVIGLKEAAETAVLQLKAAGGETFALMIRKDEIQLAISQAAARWLQETHGITLSKAKSSSARLRRKTTDAALAYEEGVSDGQSYELTKPSPKPRKARLN